MTPEILPTPNPNPTAVSLQRTFVEFWNLWAARANQAKTVHDLVPYFHENVTAIGTGDHEKGRSYQEVLKNFEDDFLEVVQPIDITYGRILPKVLSPEVGLVEAEADLKVYVEEETLDFHLRFSTTFVRQEDRWKIVHNYVSIPSDGQNIGEAYPVDKLRAKNNRLRKLVADRTFELETQTQLLQQEKERTELLLHNILPKSVAGELLTTGTTKPKRFEEVSILFTDFSGFTNIVSTIPSKKLIQELNDIFGTFDDIVESEQIEKIKTIGDAYLAVGGILDTSEDHAHRCVRAARRMIEFLEARNQKSAIKWQVRVGIHSGPVVAGVVGKRKFVYDVFGDTINIASRIETAGAAGRINVSAYTYYLINEEFPCEYRGKITAKGKGDIDMYFVRE